MRFLFDFAARSTSASFIPRGPMRYRPLPSVFAALLALLPLRGFGSVTQVDGTIIPVANGATNCDGVGGDNLQICFNNEEGFSPPNAQSIDVIKDAEIFPEIFLPDT